jgi:hypothetical protein
VQKADMAVSDLTSGGVLVREQAQQFFVVAINGANALSRVRTYPLGRNQKEIPKLTTFGAQVLRPATEMEELPLAYRSKPGFDKVTISTNEVIAQINFPKYFLKAQVEKEQFRSTLTAYLGMHVSRDLDKWIIQGDTTSTNTFLALADGIRVSTTSNSASAGGASFDSTIMESMIQLMPDEFADQDNLEFWVSRGCASSYKKELQNRIGAMADALVRQGGGLQYDGYPIVTQLQIPTTLGVGGNQTVSFFFDPKNWLFGVEEEMEMESEYHITSRMWTLVLTMRIGQLYQHEPMAVQETALANS